MDANLLSLSAALHPFVDEEGVRYVPVRPRPPITLLRHYRNPWKAAYHHFQRYSDVRVKGQSLLHPGQGKPATISCSFVHENTVWLLMGLLMCSDRLPLTKRILVRVTCCGNRLQLGFLICHLTLASLIANILYLSCQVTNGLLKKIFFT